MFKTKIICKHNGTILNDYGFDNIFIELEQNKELTSELKKQIISRIQFRNTDKCDFEYGIGGVSGDEYFKIKNMNFANNNTSIIVKVSKVSKY